MTASGGDWWSCHRVAGWSARPRPNRVGASEEVQVAGGRESLAAAGRAELAVEARHVRLDGVLREEERARDIGVRRAAGELAEHLPLPRAEQGGHDHRRGD